MNKGVKMLLCFIIVITVSVLDARQEVKLYVPSEMTLHEGTWLQWPYIYGGDGEEYKYEDAWVRISTALHRGENLHIAVFSDKEKERVKGLLENADVNMERVDFHIVGKESSVTGNREICFVYNRNDELVVVNWKSEKIRDKKDKSHGFADKISRILNLPRLSIDFLSNLKDMDVDGKGTMIVKTGESRINKEDCIKSAEKYLRRNFGIKRFIWLNEGYARFVDSDTIVVSGKRSRECYSRIRMAINAKGAGYRIVGIPETELPVEGTRFSGSYVDFYVGNSVVLIPQYYDNNDSEAVRLFQQFYPDREIVGVDCRKLFRNGIKLRSLAFPQPMSR